MATNAEDILDALGLESLGKDSPIGSITLDPGHPGFKQPAHYQYTDAPVSRGSSVSYKSMSIISGKLVGALERCIPYSASVVRAIFKVTATSLSQLHIL